jgi:hypothetical protein
MPEVCRKLGVRLEIDDGPAVLVLERQVEYPLDAAIAAIPADSRVEDAIERLVLLAKIDRGLAQVRDVRHSTTPR